VRALLRSSRDTGWVLCIQWKNANLKHNVHRKYLGITLNQARNQGGTGQLPPGIFKRTRLVVRHNDTLQSFVPLS